MLFRSRVHQAARRIILLVCLNFGRRRWPSEFLLWAKPAYIPSGALELGLHHRKFSLQNLDRFRQLVDGHLQNDDFLGRRAPRNPSRSSSPAHLSRERGAKHSVHPRNPQTFRERGGERRRGEAQVRLPPPSVGPLKPYHPVAPTVVKHPVHPRCSPRLAVADVRQVLRGGRCSRTLSELEFDANLAFPAQAPNSISTRARSPAEARVR